MHELDASATSARVPERIIGVAWVPTDPAHVLFLFVIVVFRRRRRRRRRHVRFVLRKRRGRFDSVCRRGVVWDVPVCGLWRRRGDLHGSGQRSKSGWLLIDDSSVSVLKLDLGIWVVGRRRWVSAEIFIPRLPLVGLLVSPCGLNAF